jgi:hypothetical protein
MDTHKFTRFERSKNSGEDLLTITSALSSYHTTQEAVVAAKSCQKKVREERASHSVKGSRCSFLHLFGVHPAQERELLKLTSPYLSSRFSVS